MQELLCSIHNYTKFSGGRASFYDMAQSALSVGLDAVFTTDKNIYPEGHSRLYYRDRKSVMILCGEELFDPIDKSVPRYLSLGIEKEQFGKKSAWSQEEIRISTEDPAGDSRFRHFELINAQELLYHGIDNAQEITRKKISAFESLLMNDLRCVGLAGTCSSQISTGHTFAELFSTVCNHLYISEELTGDLSRDRLQVLKALKNGNLFLALDGLCDAKGFRFTAEGNDLPLPVCPGETITMKNSVTLKINIPEVCLCRLIRNGKIIKEWQHCRQVPYTVYEPGFYRVECALLRRRKLYDWIFSNPIYVRRG